MVVMTDQPALDELYLTWLYSHVGETTSQNKARTHWILLGMLHHIPFYWTHPMDANRAQDGIDLRPVFLEAHKIESVDSAWLEEQCSVLEMMVALSWHLDFTGGGGQSARFWEMVANLGLGDATDACPPDEDVVRLRVERFLNRDIDPDGVGGLFPLKRHGNRDKDQREVDIWYQANAYLLEQI